MGFLKRVWSVRGVSSLLASAAGIFGSRPSTRREVSFSPRFDGVRGELTRGLTFRRLRDFITAGNAGDLATGLRVFEEFEERDTHLASVARTRRLALTGLDWQLTSAAEVQEDVADRALADRVAAGVRDQLSALDGFEEALEHLATAIGPNLAVLEILWNPDGTLADLVPVPSSRLIMRPNESPGVFIMTDAEPRGIPAEPGKFIVHVPNPRSGSPVAAGLSRVCAFTALVKVYALADWATFAEKFGMPIRAGMYKSGATAEEKRELADMLANMGSSGWSMFSEAVTLTLQESTQRGVQPYEALLSYCDRQIAIAFLGGHLTVDTAGATGTYAAGAVQNEVRQDIRDDDIRRESRTIRRQLIAPMVKWMMAGREAPLPHFERIKPETGDLVQRAELLRKSTQELGMLVESDYAYRELRIPAPELDQAGKPIHGVIRRIAVNPFEGEP